jgi:hypothetical protein
MIRPFSKVFIFIVCFASVALADDFKTIDGKEYKNVKVSRVEPDGIVLSNKSGISKVYFTELPKEVQERFHYDAQKGAEFMAQTKGGLDQLLRQRAEESEKQAEERARYWGERAQVKSQQTAETVRQQQQVVQTGVQQQTIDRQEEILFLLGKVHRPGMSVVLPPPQQQAALWKEYLQLQMSRTDLPEQARQQATDQLRALQQEEQAEERRQRQGQIAQAQQAQIEQQAQIDSRNGIFSAATASVPGLDQRTWDRGRARAEQEFRQSQRQAELPSLRGERDPVKNPFLSQP